MKRSDEQSLEHNSPAFLAGGGEMGERTRGFDWSKTPLGPISTWPHSLKIAVRIMLDSRYAMWLGWGPEFTFFYNDAYARMTLGAKHPWALGRTAREVWSEIWDAIGPRAESVVRTGQATWDEGLLLFLERRGFLEETYHTFSYSPIPDDHAAIGGMLCVVTEDTERTIGERRLRTLRELAARTTDTPKSTAEACQSAIQTLAETPNDLPFVLIYLLNEDRVARLAGVTGVPPGSAAAAPSLNLARPAAPEANWPLQAVLASGRAEHVTDLVKRFGALPCGHWPEPPERAVILPMTKPGQTRLAGFVVAGISPRLPFNDEYLGFLDLLAGHIANAINNAQAHEEERKRAEALAELDRAKTTFFSNVSHEFRTPLTLMLGPVEDLLASGHIDLSAAAKQHLEVVQRNGQRLLRLVNSLLDFSRIEAGRVRAVYQPTDLAAFTAELASVFRAAIERAGLRLVVDCPKLSEPVYVDRDMWEKVVLNLLSNAFKFTFHGEIDIRLQQNENRVELSVRDTGIGIPPEEMPRMFERFHRVEKARGRTHEGSGIGLALVQELVKLHGGTITAASVLGAGTTFTVAIPLGLAHLPADQIGDYRNPDSLLAGAMPYVEEALRWLPDDEPRTGPSELPSYHESVPIPHLGAKPEEDANRPRVLIADDNADMRQYIARLLAERHQVETAPDGEAALAAARKEPPDLIVTDVMMPRLDGFGLLRELRADVRTRDVPVIMLSARAGEESRVEGMEAGADDYVVKPFSARELLARVSAHLQMARMRRETSETLREGEERLSMALTAAHMVAWQYEPSTHKVVVSDNAASVFGLLPEFKLENIDLGISLLHPDDGARHRAIMMKAVEEGTNYLSEYRIIRPVDHTTIWLEERGHAVRGGPGEGVRLVGVVMDITERKRAEDAMRRQSEQLGQLAEVATRFNAAHDVDSITAVVTEEARTLIRSHQAVTSFSIDQNWGQAINVVCLSEKYAAWRGYDEKPDGTGIYALVCRTNKSMRLTQAELEAHPNYKWFGKHAQHHPPLRGWLAAPLVGRDGRNLGLIQLSDKYEGEFSEEDEAILVQLAQMASVAIEKGRLVQDLLEADRRKDEFLATLAHELRNPLAPLRNGLQLMKLAQANPGNKLSVDLVEQARLLMERQLGQMVRLVDDLLDVSRISRGKVILQKSRIALAMAIENALETSRSLIEAAGHELTLDLPSEPVFVDADETRLSQIFANLLNNAAKYTDPGGRIRVAVEREEREVIVSVEDNGVGIPAPMLARVFEMFTQVDRSLEKSQGGLGIGLTIVKRLIELHGGTIEARSEGHGLGSQFIVRLPVAQELPGRPEDNGDKDEIAVARRRRILVVDDNRDSAVSLAMMLEIMGNVTKTAHDGLEALDVAATFRPDVVLLDIGMPRLNGYDAARRIREQPWGREMVLVAQTGWGQEEDKRRSREAGFNFHMVKPLDPAALEKLLGELQQSQG